MRAPELSALHGIPTKDDRATKSHSLKQLVYIVQTSHTLQSALTGSPWRPRMYHLNAPLDATIQDNNASHRGFSHFAGFLLMMVLTSTVDPALAGDDSVASQGTAAPQGWDLSQPAPTSAPLPPSATADLNLVVTEILPYQLGCERPDDNQTNCNSGCAKADELGYILDPSAGLAYNPSAFRLAANRYAVLTQSGCGGDFLETFQLDLTQETVTRTGLIRDTSQFNCPEDPPNRPPRPEVLGGPDVLPLTSSCGPRGKGTQPTIAFFSFGNSDTYLGRLAWAHSSNGTSWNIHKEPFLLYPVCPGSESICEKLGVATVAALDEGDYYYLYVNLFNGGGPQGIILMRVEKSCASPYVVLAQGGAQVFNKLTRQWDEMAFDANDGYLLETCPTNGGSLEAYRLIISGSSLGVSYNTTDGYLITHKVGTGELRYLRSDEPTFDAGNAPAHTIDATLLADYYRYELCPGGTAPANPGDPCIYDWDLRNHHIELEQDPATGDYRMFFTRMNTTDTNKFRFASVRLARVEKSPSATPIPAPSGVRASDGEDTARIEVQWNLVTGATNYEVWRHTVQKPGASTLVATVPHPNSSFLDNTVVPGTTYHYWVRAKNSQTISGFSPSDPGFAAVLTCRSGRIDAEDGTLTGFQIMNDGARGYIVVPDGSVGGPQGPSEQYKARYCVDVPTAGNYRIRGQIRAPSFGADSFFVRVDGGPDYLWVTSPLNNWTDDFVNDTHGSNIVDPVEVVLSAGQHTVDIFMREDGTEIDSFELVPAAAPSCGGLSQEAEDGTLTGFQIMNDGARGYIVVPDGSVGGPQGPSEQYKARYCVDVPTAGNYRIRGQIRAPSFGADSFFVRVDGGPDYLWVTSPLNNWTDDFVNDTHGSNIVDPVEVVLSAGQHTVDIFMREDGTEIDSFTLLLQ